jgi:corrinoid protein of di/trimethylamine methyltransferase
MKQNELLGQLQKSVIDGVPERASSYTVLLLEKGVDPLTIIDQALVPGIQFTGEQFSCGEMFLPDLMLASEAMQASLKLCNPELHRRGLSRKSLGRVVLGTISGDIHEIGKNLVGTLLSANGFEVFDLGVNVPVETFTQKALELKADLVGVSALLTTTMDGQRKVIEAIDQANLRPAVKIIIGGAPVTDGWAKEIKADGYSEDAIGAVTLAKRLLNIPL